MRKRPASTVYVSQSGITSLANATMFVTYAIYYVRVLHLTPFQLLLVGTSIEATMLLCEIPTGLIADVWGRRPCIITGFAIVGVALILEGTIPMYVHQWFGFGFFVALTVMGFEVLRGMGEAFLNGATDAWITDEVGPEVVGKVFARAAQVAQPYGMAGIGLSVGLGLIHLNAPYIAGGCMYVSLSVILFFTLEETRHPKSNPGEKPSWMSLWIPFRNSLRSVRAKPILLVFLILEVFIGAATEGFDRLWEAFLLMMFRFPTSVHLSVVAWFGISSVIGAGLGWIAVTWMGRNINLENMSVVSRLVVVFTTLRIIFLFTFALSHDFYVALVSIWLIGLFSILLQPLQITWVNQNFGSEVRATFLSLLGQTNALGQTVGGPFVGFIGSRFSIRTALVCSAALWTPVLGLYIKARRTKSG